MCRLACTVAEVWNTFGEMFPYFLGDASRTEAAYTAGDYQRLREADRPGQHAERLRALFLDLEAHARVRHERRERVVGDGDHRNVEPGSLVDGEVLALGIDDEERPHGGGAVGVRVEHAVLLGDGAVVRDQRERQRDLHDAEHRWSGADDGRVVSFLHGCGAHSEAQLRKKQLPPPMSDPAFDTLTRGDLEQF